MNPANLIAVLLLIIPFMYRKKKHIIFKCLISNQNGNKNQLNAVMVKNLKLEYDRRKYTFSMQTFMDISMEKKHQQNTLNFNCRQYFT